MEEGVVRIGKEKHCTTLMAGEAAAEVKSGTTVVFETNDYNYAALSRGEEVDLETVNVVTGPLRVTGAQPGDVLRVDILDIRITRCWSVWASDAKACGCLAAKRALFSRDSSVRELPVEGGRVTVSERLRLPLRPMIGCLATASADPSLSSTFEPTYRNGGNMDLRLAEPGNAVLLPVLVEGGMLFVGDLHAAMGQGEPTWVGFEAAGEATVRVTLLKNFSPPLPFPRLLVGDSTVFTAVAADDETRGEYASAHDWAMQEALAQAYDHLVGPEEKLTEEEAFGFLTAQAEALFGGPASRQAIIIVPSPKAFLS